MPRLFISINLNDEMKDALMGIQDTMRSYGMHITLMRRATGAAHDIPAGELEEFFGTSMVIDHISLMRSDRGKHGMIYTEL